MTNWKRLAKTLSTPGAQREAAVGRASAALATLIAQRLAAKEMTQEQLATALDITPGAVSRKLKEGCDMRLSSVAAILWAVDVPLYWEFERLCEEGWARTSSNVIELRDVMRRRREFANVDVETVDAGEGGWSARA